MKNKSKFYLSFLKKKFLEKEINQLAKKYIKERYIRLATISYDGIANYTNIYGFYENEIINILSKILKKNNITNVFLDVGANYGTYSVYLSKYFKKVMAFEADPRIYKLLDFNTENFPNINCLNYAVSDSKGSKKFYIDFKNFGANSLIKKRFNKTIKVKSNTLDKLVKKQTLNNSFVKIDTEGSEILVLKGMNKTLNSKNLIIGIEQLKEEFFIKENTYKSKCLELLKKKGFNFFYEIEIKEWRFEHSYFSKFFKLLEIIFFIKPSTDVKLKRINIFKKKNYQQIICSKKDIRNI